MQILFEILGEIKQKRGIGVENPSPRSFSGGAGYSNPKKEGKKERGHRA